MTSSSQMRALPHELAEVFDRELGEISAEIVRVIGEEVAEYARPLEGSFGHGLRTGVTEALRRFVASIADPGSDDEPGRRIYVALGRQEHMAGRTLDALQAAYRVGARVAWRRFAVLGNASDLPPETMASLAESIFAYIDELSSESVEGYAQAQAERAGELGRARSELLGALLSDPRPDVDLAALSARAGWPLPGRAAALVCAVDALPGIGRRLGPEVIHATQMNLGCVVIPDADGPGRLNAVRLAVRDTPAAIGPTGTLGRLARSWRIASRVLESLGADGLAVTDDHMAALVMSESRIAAERISELRLAALDDLTPVARDRMMRTALAFVQYQGNAAAMAGALNVHPQTARYRIARLRELLGTQLDEPDARFELEIALRSRIEESAQGPPRGLGDPCAGARR